MFRSLYGAAARTILQFLQRPPTGRVHPRFRLCRLESCEQRTLLTFHLWQIDQVFSSADGKVQFIELHDPSNGEDLLSGHFIKSNEHTFTFPSNLSTDATSNKHFLIGTTSYAALPGAAAPDYVVPDNFFNPAGDAFDYADVDTFSFTAGQLPTDGVKSLFRDVSSGAVSTATNSETNLAGQTASVTVSSAPPVQVNLAPTINAIADPATIPPNSGQQTVNLTGISAGAGETQNLTITAVSDNPALIPNPVVSYTSPNSTGSLTYTPVPGAQGTAAITVTIKDDGGTANGGHDTTTVTFHVTIGVTQQQVYVQHLISDLLGRQATDAEVQRLSSQLTSGASRADVAGSVLNSPEHLNDLVGALYQQLLGRAPDAAGLAFWEQRLSSGDESAVAAGIAASDEFFSRAGGDNRSFVDALYHAVLGRSGEADGVAFWEGLLAHGSSRGAVAQGFAGSHEFHGLLVDDPQALLASLPGWYQNYFHRPADEAGRSFFTNQLDAGAAAETVALEVLASDEYFNRST